MKIVRSLLCLANPRSPKRPQSIEERRCGRCRSSPGRAGSHILFEKAINKTESHPLTVHWGQRKEVPWQFNLSQSIEILERTPEALKAILEGLSAEWVEQNEGPETFSPFDVVGHLIHGERTDWIPRLQMIFSQDPATVFEPFDRFAMYEASRGKSLARIMQEP